MCSGSPYPHGGWEFSLLTPIGLGWKVRINMSTLLQLLLSLVSSELIISGKGTNEVVEDHRGKKKTVPDSAYRQNYTYKAFLDEEQTDSYADGNVERIDDHGMLLEMAFDET